LAPDFLTECQRAGVMMLPMMTPRDALAKTLEARADLIDVACALFDYAQYLLDDDQRLTRSGALDGAGRDLLKQRAHELLGGPEKREHAETDEADDHEEGAA
jgi:hypothetical protein